MELKMKAQRPRGEKLRLNTEVVESVLPSDFDHCVLPRGYFDRYMTSLDAPRRQVLSVENWPPSAMATTRDDASK